MTSGAVGASDTVHCLSCRGVHRRRRGVRVLFLFLVLFFFLPGDRRRRGFRVLARRFFVTFFERRFLFAVLTHRYTPLDARRETYHSPSLPRLCVLRQGSELAGYGGPGRLVYFLVERR